MRRGDQATGTFDEVGAAFVDKYGPAGLAIGVVRDGALAYTRCFGDAVTDDDRPVTSSTVFRVGSIAKTFTAIAVMQLVEAGRCSLDDPVTQHLHSVRLRVPAGAPPVTIRHLLTHTSGVGELRRVTDLVRPFFGMGVKEGREMPSLEEYYAPALIAGAPAGQKWAYANHGFAVLGAMIEDITGEAYGQYMRSQLLDPLGMSGSDFTRSERVVTELATGYARGRRGKKPVRYLDIIVASAGALFSSVQDMALYMAALCSGGGRVLGPDCLDEMMRPQYRVDDRLAPMGLGFFLDDLAGHRVVSHAGNVPGFVSSMHVAPDDGIGVIVMTNSASIRIILALNALSECLLSESLGIPAGERSLPRSGVGETPNIWSELAGSYGLHPGLNTNARPWMYFGGEVEIASTDDHLVLRTLTGPLRKGHRLFPVDPGDPRVFQVDVGGTAVGVAFADDELHFGPPLNATVYKRAYSIRRRLRKGLAVTGTIATMGLGMARVLRSRR